MSTTKNIFKKQESDENNIYKYLWRVGSAIENGVAGISWTEATPYINEEWCDKKEDYRNSATYRKPVQNAMHFYENVFSGMDNLDEEDLVELKQEIRKEKQKLFDERTALNRKLREQARNESLYDIVERAVTEHRKYKLNIQDRPSPVNDTAMIIHLTDVHCGLNVTSALNVIDNEILAERFERYIEKIRTIQMMNESKEAHIILGGDLISGLIHINTRIETKENIVEQILNATDLIEDFISEMYMIFPFVNVYSVAGNHGRAVASKEEALNDENFDTLIFKILAKSFKDTNGIKFHDNFIASDIAVFKCMGHTIYATHGDKDTPKNVVDHMNQIAKRLGISSPDVCFLGHRHQNGMHTVGVAKVIESGCVGGVDNYAISKRYSGFPEQSVVLVTKDNAVDTLYNVVLDSFDIYS